MRVDRAEIWREAVRAERILADLLEACERGEVTISTT